MAVEAILWLTIVFLPIIVGLGLTQPPFRNALTRVAPSTAIPALVVALLPDTPASSSVPWLLLGSMLGLEPLTRVFLLLTAALWIAAGTFASTYMARDANRTRFWLFFLLTMAGNLGLIISLDVVTFYFSFALMTFAGFGLIIHEGSNDARRAGKVYIIMAVFGEAMLLASFMLLAFASNSIAIAPLSEGLNESSYRPLIISLLVAGFGVKAGVIPLHVWLPLAHPVAPTPASAVLSGAMIKAGLLGWLRFLPLGESPMRTWGVLFVAVGIGAAYAAAIAGSLQRDPKTVLAYSSISQMGVISSVVGVIMVEPTTWEPMGLAVAFYALHHGLAKGALFLGVGVAYSYIRKPRHRTLVNAAMVLPALALVGAPLFSGAAAKNAIKEPIALAGAQWEQWMTWLLLIAAIGTTVLMARFLYLIRPSAVVSDVHHLFEAGLWLPWAALTMASAFSAFLAPLLLPIESIAPLHLEPPYLWQGAWPVLAGLLIFWVVNQLRGRGYGRRVPQIPPGDILVLAEAAAAWAMRPVHDRLLPAIYRLDEESRRVVAATRLRQISTRLLDDSEASIVRFGTAGVIFVGLMTTFLLLVWRW